MCHGALEGMVEAPVITGHVCTASSCLPIIHTGKSKYSALFPTLCFHRGEIGTDKAAEKGICAREQFTWQVVESVQTAPWVWSFCTDSHEEAHGCLPAHHCTALADSAVTSCTLKRGQCVTLSQSAWSSLVFEVSPVLPSVPHTNLAQR